MGQSRKPQRRVWRQPIHPEQVQGCLRFGDTRREDAAGSRGLSCSPSTDVGAYSAALASTALPSAGNEPVMNTFIIRASFIKSAAANANQPSVALGGGSGGGAVGGAGGRALSHPVRVGLWPQRLIVRERGGAYVCAECRAVCALKGDMAWGRPSIPGSLDE